VFSIVLQNNLWALEYNLHLLHVQPIGNIAERFHALCMKDSGVLYEDPYIQVFLHFFLIFSIFCFNFGHVYLLFKLVFLDFIYIYIFCTDWH